MPNRFEVVFAERAEPFDVDGEYFPAFDEKCYLVDTQKGAIVFADGSYESPEDNTLDRHYSGLVNLLNQVAAET